METIGWDDFMRVDLRAGTVLEAEPFPAARKPAYRLRIDFGPEIGIKASSAQLTRLYEARELVGKQVIAVVNFPPKQIATFFSEVLVLGLEAEAGGVTLLQAGHRVANGSRVH